MPNLTEKKTTKIIPELLQSLAGQELRVSDMKSLMGVFVAHDRMVFTNTAKNTKN